MGSLFSKPSLPQPVVYASSIPASEPAALPVAPKDSSEATNGDTERVKATIQKKRTLPQTIQTSFRGVLSQADFVPARKNLLGE